MTPGTTVIVRGDAQWNGSIFRAHYGHVVEPPTHRTTPDGWIWVKLDPRPANTPNRPLAFRASTLLELKP